MNTPYSGSNPTEKMTVMLSRLFLLWIFTISVMVNPVIAKNRISLEDKTKAAFIYHFTKFISWPDSDSSNTFNIGILGNNSIATPLKEISNLKKVGNRRIVIHQLDSIQQCSPCHILFIADPEITEFATILSHLHGANTLIVTDSKGYGEKGSCINFVVKKRKLRFEINRTSLNNMGLTASSQLLKLAVIINEDESND